MNGGNMNRGLQIFGRVLWILPALIGLGTLTWLSFLYPGIKMRKAHRLWLWVAIAYGVLAIAVIFVAGSGESSSNADGAFFVAVWFSGIILFLVMLKWWIPFSAAPRLNSESPSQSPVMPSQVTPNAPLNWTSADPSSERTRNEDAIAAPAPYRAADASFHVDGRAPITVFISHSSQDRDSAAKLAEELESRGVQTWLAFRDVQVGGNYAEEVVNAIVSANYLLVILSGDAIQSPHVRREVTIGIDKGVQLLPVNLSASEDFLWTLPVDWTYWLSLAQVMRQPNESNAAAELARRILGPSDSPF